MTRKLTRAARARGPRGDDGQRLRTLPRGAPPRGAEDHAGADRGGQEGRQGRLVHLGRPAGRREGRQGRSRRTIPGVSMKVERSGAERNLPAHRPGICRARSTICDVVNSSDAAHLIIWKREQMLAAFLPEDVAQHFPRRTRIPTACSPRGASRSRPIAYNTKLVKAEDAPKCFADLLDPKWVGQDRQGASGLQRHHHDRDPAAQPRPRLGVVREARQAEGHAGPVGRRSAEEAVRWASARSWPTAASTW